MNKLFFIGLFVFLLYGIMSESYNKKDTFKTNQNYILKELKHISKNDPPCYQMYYYINYYCDSFNVPKKYMFALANKETGYRGPFHYDYNHKKESSGGALGPMQIMLSTARSNNKDNVSKLKLKTDIKYNVYTSVKLIKKLHKKYKNWKLVFGCYNTGTPCVNSYSNYILNYKLKW